MKINCAAAGKRFNREWIFRNFTYEFLPGHKYAVTGANGSGKSTLLQVIAGATVASTGKITYSSAQRPLIEPDDAYQSLSIAAPYLEVIEEMNLVEFFEFHQTFKPLLPQTGVNDIIDIIGLKPAAQKQIRYYSSGMKQRVKLAQAIFSNTSCILLDEPSTNLDETGIQLYLRLIEDYCKERMVIVCSNDRQEYSFAGETINIMDYK